MPRSFLIKKWYGFGVRSEVEVEQKFPLHRSHTESWTKPSTEDSQKETDQAEQSLISSPPLIEESRAEQASCTLHLLRISQAKPVPSRCRGDCMDASVCINCANTDSASNSCSTHSEPALTASCALDDGHSSKNEPEKTNNQGSMKPLHEDNSSEDREEVNDAMKMLGPAFSATVRENSSIHDQFCTPCNRERTQEGDKFLRTAEQELLQIKQETGLTKAKNKEAKNLEATEQKKEFMTTNVQPESMMFADEKEMKKTKGQKIRTKYQTELRQTDRANQGEVLVTQEKRQRPSDSKEPATVNTQQEHTRVTTEQVYQGIIGSNWFSTRNTGEDQGMTKCCIPLVQPITSKTETQKDPVETMVPFQGKPPSTFDSWVELCDISCNRRESQIPSLCPNAQPRRYSHPLPNNFPFSTLPSPCPILLHSAVSPKPLLLTSISSHVASFPAQAIHLERSTIFTVKAKETLYPPVYPHSSVDSICQYHEILRQPYGMQTECYRHHHPGVPEHPPPPATKEGIRDPLWYSVNSRKNHLSSKDGGSSWNFNSSNALRNSYRTGQFSNWLVDCRCDFHEELSPTQKDACAELPAAIQRTDQQQLQKLERTRPESPPHPPGFHLKTEKRFTCKHCDKLYTSLGAMKMHIRTHTLPCKCMLCGKAFSRPWLLQGHVRTHTGEKPFHCPQCGRAFADRSNLRAHLQTHARFKKYCCTSCPKTFSRLSLLLKHQDNCSCCREYRNYSHSNNSSSKNNNTQMTY